MSRDLVLTCVEGTGGVPKAWISYTRQSLLAILLTLSCLFTLVLDAPSPAAATSKNNKKKNQDPVLKGLPVTELSTDEAIQHALNRLAYGLRPGDVERVKQMGLAKWIDLQLNPKEIDDKAVEARLNIYPTLTMTSAQLIAEYPNPKQAAKQAEQAKQPPTPEQMAQKQADDAITAMARDMDAGSSGGNEAAENNGTMASAATSADTPSPMKLNPATRGAGGKKDVLGVDPNAVPRAISDDSKRPQRVVEELAMAKMTRAIYSDRQLQQVMDDFWLNHFNVFAGKGEVKWYLTSYERDVIQPNALGKFKDLLTATAKSPAMLFYLDNFLSADPKPRSAWRWNARCGNNGAVDPPRPQQAQKKTTARPERKLWARIDGIAHAGRGWRLHAERCDGSGTMFTGWTIEKPREVAQFKFDEKLHDPDPKLVLGKKIHAGGMKDGEEVIDLLSKNPNTAKFISTKLASDSFPTRLRRSLWIGWRSVLRSPPAISGK